MHPSVYVSQDSPEHRPRRVARKRERRASCSAATPSIDISYPIPSLQSTMEKRYSGSSGSPVSHSKIERTHSGSSRSRSKIERKHSGSLRSRSKIERQHSESTRTRSKIERQHSGSTRTRSNIERQHSGSSASIKSHSKLERRNSGSAGSPLSHPKMERRSSGSAGSPLSNQKVQRRSSLSSVLSNGFTVSSYPRTERRTSLSGSSSLRMERRLSGSASLPFGMSNAAHPKMTRRSSCGPAPYNSPAGISVSCHTRLQRRDSCGSTASLSDSFNSVCSVKSCSFREEPEIRHVQSATDMVDDPSDLWFQKQDFENFREKTRRIISNVDEHGRGKNGKKYCTRGLEKYMAAASIKRKNIRKNILLALEDGNSDSLKGYSESCVSEAQRLGATDAKAANTYCKRMFPFRRASVQ